VPDPYTVAANLESAAEAVVVKVTGVVREYAQLGLARVRVNASGRPGPRRVTGDYLRTMSIEYDGATAATIGTNAVQARRLEFGFVGADSLGRVYNQAPLPHWRPMADWIEEPFTGAVARAIESGGL